MTGGVQAQRAPGAPAVAGGGGGGGSCRGGRVGTPLWQVVEEVQSEWFEEEITEARGGNPVSMALVGQMLIQGYGCVRDPGPGREWVAKALVTAEGKSDYAHLMAGWRALYEHADKQPIVERRPR